MSENSSGPMDAVAAGEELSEWVADVPGLVMRLDTWHTPEHFHPDMSADSLGTLEETVVLTYEPEGTDESRDFLQGAMAYLGEALMHVGGGRWGWNTAGHPVVLPDAELRMEPLDPLLLINSAMETAQFGVFEETADRLRAAVAARREQQPGWRPVKEATPGLDPTGVGGRHPWLAAWVEERRSGFDAWAAETGSEKSLWDFSPASLDALARLVIHRYGTTEKFADRERTPFVQGCIWYVGEVAVRHKAGAWEFHEADEGLPREEVERNIYLERPFVNQPTIRDGVGDVPFYALLLAVEAGDGSVVREHFDWYEDPSKDPSGEDGSVVYRRG
ncbi:hypothetical protein ACFU5O_18055 [Streptomyces sp. NPDC057445]|uniref:hypothetical protein n=1 Tax=Streptomyces sp. NPDC057445 TaxID=3346136 RepID=UPI00369F6630